MIADGALRRVRGCACTPMRMDNGIWRRYCVLYGVFVKKCSLDKDSACILLASSFLTFYTLILILPQYYPNMFTKLSLPHVCCAVICLGFITNPPVLNAAVTLDPAKVEGLLQGDLYQLKGNSASLTRNARIEGTWYVPGTPRLVLNGGTLQSGSIIDGAGSIKPSGYAIRLNGKSFVETIVNRTVLTDLPIVEPVEKFSGKRKVDIRKQSDTVGDPSTIRDLHLHKANKKNTRTIRTFLPGGAYNKISVHDNSTLVLGTPGSTEPEIYNVQELELKENGQIEVVGPIVLRLKDELKVETYVGNEAHPE